MNMQTTKNGWKSAPHSEPHLEEETRLEMYHRYRQGETVAELAERFGCSEARVLRILAQVRHQRIQQLPLEHVPNEEFARVTLDEEKKLLGPAPAAENIKRTPRPSGIPSYLASLYEVPLLTREQELHLFRKLNYLKYKADNAPRAARPEPPEHVTLMDEIESCTTNRSRSRTRLCEPTCGWWSRLRSAT